MKIGVAPSLLLAIYCLVGVTSCGLHRPAESPHAGVDVPPAEVSVLITMDFDPSAPGFLQAVQEGFVWVELVRALKPQAELGLVVVTSSSPESIAMFRRENPDFVARIARVPSALLRRFAFGAGQFLVSDEGFGRLDGYEPVAQVVSALGLDPGLVHERRITEAVGTIRLFSPDKSRVNEPRLSVIRLPRYCEACGGYGSVLERATGLAADSFPPGAILGLDPRDEPVLMTAAGEQIRETGYVFVVTGAVPPDTPQFVDLNLDHGSAQRSNSAAPARRDDYLRMESVWSVDDNFGSALLPLPYHAVSEAMAAWRPMRATGETDMMDGISYDRLQVAPRIIIATADRHECIGLSDRPATANRSAHRSDLALDGSRLYYIDSDQRGVAHLRRFDMWTIEDRSVPLPARGEPIAVSVCSSERTGYLVSELTDSDRRFEFATWGLDSGAILSNTSGPMAFGFRRFAAGGSMAYFVSSGDQIEAWNICGPSATLTGSVAFESVADPANKRLVDIAAHAGRLYVLLSGSSRLGNGWAFRPPDLVCLNPDGTEVDRWRLIPAGLTDIEELDDGELRAYGFGTQERSFVPVALCVTGAGVVVLDAAGTAWNGSLPK